MKPLRRNLPKSTTADLRLIVAIGEEVAIPKGFDRLLGIVLPNRSLKEIKAKEISGNMGLPAAVYPTVILIDRSMCRELLPWSSPENIGPSL